MLLGIEIGGTKLQFGIGPGDGTMRAFKRLPVDVPRGAERIRQQILQTIPELLAEAELSKPELKGMAFGFGGPVDDTTRRVIKSHQVSGWDDFPLAEWAEQNLDLPALLGNDADVAGLAEALFGAGKGLSPIFYITIGSGIGGALITNGEIYRGSGKGAAEIGQVDVSGGSGTLTLEQVASGWGIARIARDLLREYDYKEAKILSKLVDRDFSRITCEHVAEAARSGDSFAQGRFHAAVIYLAEAVSHVVNLLCPRRIIIGGGVSLVGEELLFGPLRTQVGNRVLKPFTDCYDIVPAALGEEVVVHGALALARKRFAGGHS